jgi:hypothetical protein
MERLLSASRADSRYQLWIRQSLSCLFLLWRIVEHLVESIVEWLRVTQIIRFYNFFYNCLNKKCTIIGNTVLLILLKYLTLKRKHIYLLICIYFSFWATLLVLHHQLKTLLAQLEPLLEIEEISEEFQYWWIRIVDL